MSNPCLILEWSDAGEWQLIHAIGSEGPRRIPQLRQPAVLQPTREIAEQEAQRLAGQHPGKTFAVFEAAVVATTVTVPTHVTVGGTVFGERRLPALLEVGCDRIPF